MFNVKVPPLRVHTIRVENLRVRWLSRRVGSLIDYATRVSEYSLLNWKLRFSIKFRTVSSVVLAKNNRNQDKGSVNIRR